MASPYSCAEAIVAAALLDNRPFAAVGVEGAIPVTPARAGKAVLGALGERESFLAQPQCLVRVAEQPQTPSVVGATTCSQFDAVFIGQMRRLVFGKGAIMRDSTVQMRTGIRQRWNVQPADPHQQITGDPSPGVVRPTCPIEEVVGGGRCVCMVSAGPLEKPNAEQYGTDADIVADLRAQLARAAKSAGRFGRGIAFGAKLAWPSSRCCASSCFARSCVSGSCANCARPVVRCAIASRLAERWTARSPARCQYLTACEARPASL
jgi:hypothetical protein